MFEDLTRQEQDERSKKWKDPIAYTVVATVLFRRNDTAPLGIEFFVTQRLKGACRKFYQSHHGGHVKVTDRNLCDAARRELEEETAYVIPEQKLRFVAIFGPELYRSTMTVHSKDDQFCLDLEITKIPAEPKTPFVLTLFIGDATGAKKNAITDGEVSSGEWLSFVEIIERYGQSMTFNYCSMLFEALRAISGHQTNIFPVSAPGKYCAEISRIPKEPDP